jgi:hypothetical protein
MNVVNAATKEQIALVHSLLNRVIAPFRVSTRVKAASFE